ncbi:MAG: hypothetical protein ACRD38_02350 [Nitrososphaerales archaeon]
MKRKLQYWQNPKNESKTHYFIKETIAKALRKLGYVVTTEARTEGVRLDILAKKGAEVLKIEIQKTHAPEWLIARVRGDINFGEPIKSLNIRLRCYHCNSQWYYKGNSRRGARCSRCKRWVNIARAFAREKEYMAYIKKVDKQLEGC